MKRVAAGLVALFLVLLATVLLVGDSSKPSESEKPAGDESLVEQQPVDPMSAATQELQFMLEVVSNSVPVSTWEPEQPVAELVKEATCEAPNNDAWQISWAGAIAGERNVFDENIQNVFASSSDYEVTKINDDEYAILGTSGFNAGVRWNEEAGQVQLEFESACFQDTQPAS